MTTTSHFSVGYVDKLTARFKKTLYRVLSPNKSTEEGAETLEYVAIVGLAVSTYNQLLPTVLQNLFVAILNATQGVL